MDKHRKKKNNNWLYERKNINTDIKLCEFKNGCNTLVNELRVVQFWSEIIFVISNQTRIARSFDFKIMRMISDQIALHSVQLPLYNILIISKAQIRTKQLRTPLLCCRIYVKWMQMNAIENHKKLTTLTDIYFFFLTTFVNFLWSDVRCPRHSLNRNVILIWE